MDSYLCCDYIRERFLLFVRLVVGFRVNPSLLSFLNWLRNKFLPYLNFLLVSEVVDECSKPYGQTTNRLRRKRAI